MKIKLPDGTILNAPNGADVKQVVRGYRLAQLKAKDPGEYDPTSPEFKEKYGATAGTSNLQRFIEGAGSGLSRVGRGAVNLALPDKLTPEFASDESIRRARELDTELGETGAGAFGQFVGETVGTLPIGGAVGGGVKALGAAARGAPTVLKLAKGASSAPSRAALEGAITSAVVADPDKRGQAAMLGAGVGGLLSGAGSAAGRVLRGAVKKSQAARDLEFLSRQAGEEIQLPISAGAEEKGVSGVVKSIYKDYLPIIPGVAGKIGRQVENASEKFRELALKEGLVEGGHLPTGIGAETSRAKSILQNSLDNIYNKTVKSLDYNIPSNFEENVVESIRKKIPNVDDTSVIRTSNRLEELVNRFAKSGEINPLTNKAGNRVIEGENLMDINDEINFILPRLRGKEKQAMLVAQEEIEGLIQTRLKPQGLLKEYLDLAEPSEALKVLSKAMKSAKGDIGNFTPKQLARAAKEESPLEMLGHAGHETLSKAKQAANFARGRMLAGVAGIGALGFYDPSLITSAMVLGSGQVLGSKKFQQSLFGNTKTQRVLAELLRKNPKLKEDLGQVLRTTATTQVGEANASR